MKIFTQNIDQSLMSKLNKIEDSGVYHHIRIMPDVHDGSFVVGFTAIFDDRLSPDIIGSDIGCGMLCVNLGKSKVDPAKLDRVIRRYVPSGKDINDRKDKFVQDFRFDYTSFNCYKNLNRLNELERAIGTLGASNHFLELDIDEDSGDNYLVIHTGSRNLGKQIWAIYRTQSTCQSSNEIEGDILDRYLYDAQLASRWARLNRELIAEKILAGLNLRKLKYYEHFDCPHNFIDGSIIRKGACKAIGKIIIPMNMRDGSLLCTGKENEDWNFSAPHGAGRIMSRAQARKVLSIEQYKKEMQNVYSSSVCEATIDESPMAYKPMEEIVGNIKDSVAIDKIIKPVYNFKSLEVE